MSHLSASASASCVLHSSVSSGEPERARPVHRAAATHIRAQRVACALVRRAITQLPCGDESDDACTRFGKVREGSLPILREKLDTYTRLPSAPRAVISSRLRRGERCADSNSIKRASIFRPRFLTSFCCWSTSRITCIVKMIYLKNESFCYLFLVKLLFWYFKGVFFLKVSVLL